MRDKKVIVLLSAYNGERYVAQQIDSILAQTYDNIDIYVRDDGSKDNTCSVLEKYEKEGKIHLERGENVGFIKSFFWLIENAGDADYYAFSDQDDVWFEDKISMAVEKLEAQNSADRPTLYFSNYDYYDGELNFLAHHSRDIPKISFRNSMVDCVSLGFNSVFNRKARELTLENMPQHSCGHDWWMYMLCAGIGNVIYDNRSTAKYRRHNSNVSDGGDSFIKFQIWRIKKFFMGGYFKNIHEQLKEYRDFFGSELSVDDQKLLERFCVDGLHPINTLCKVFYPKAYRQKMVDEIFLRLIILIGKL